MGTAIAVVGWLTLGDRSRLRVSVIERQDGSRLLDLRECAESAPGQFGTATSRGCQVGLGLAPALQHLIAQAERKGAST